MKKRIMCTISVEIVTDLGNNEWKCTKAQYQQE
jgi:hypothetical protein